jgi:hypothetical protein
VLIRFAIRDVSIAGVTAFLWWAFAEHSAGTGIAADLAGWLVGTMLFVCAYLAHEWSHFLGAVAMGSRVEVGQRLASGFLFSFPAEGNGLAQFVVMSLAGFAATGLAIGLCYGVLPDAYLASRVARGGALFLGLLGLVLELPLLLYGVATRSVPTQAAV